MALQIVSGTPGLWRDPQWTSEMPGVYALVVGISRYPHFADGDPAAPATDNFGMGQLACSATTAADIFEWLRDNFKRQGLPVIWCELLLSPTADEKGRLDGRGLTHYATPTNVNLRNAIDMWTGNVPATDAAAATSRTFFFFSGHGVQTNWYPLLLPSDYLDPSLGKAKLENCIGVSELTTWMERNPVAEHLALIDACRNEFTQLAAKASTANTSFPINAPGGRPPRTAASLSATSPNDVAYQSPSLPHTFFGEAVLEAVRNGILGGSDPHLEFHELVDYVKPRINILIQNAQPGTTLQQAARPRVDGDDAMVVTEIAAPLAAPQPGALEATRGLGPAPAAPAKSCAPPTAMVLKAMAARFDPALAVPEPIALEAMRQDFGQIHRRFGHEYASHLWRDGMALFALKDGQHIEVDGNVVRDVQRNDASSLIAVDLVLAPREGGVLLAFIGAQFVERELLAVALPTDMRGSVPIRLGLRLSEDKGNTPSKLIGIDARLGPSDENPHYQYLWELTREADVGSLSQAAASADPQRLKLAAQDKINGQTAAVAGMLLLARAGRIGDVGDWTRNLMRWFPDIPDGAVLWAESLRNALAAGTAEPFGVKAPIEEIASALLSIEQRGLPFFADSLELTDRLLRYVARQLSQGSARLEALQNLQTRLELVFQTAKPSGHFISVSGLPRPPGSSNEPGPLSADEVLTLLGHPPRRPGA